MSFLGVLIDQQTIVGRGFVRNRPELAPDEVDVIQLTVRDVGQINGQVASNADIIAGSAISRVSQLGTAERARRLKAAGGSS